MSNRHINVVLFEPEIAQNTGNIARTCAVAGATLHLVEPLGFRLTERNLKRSGCDYWDQVEIKHYATSAAFLQEHNGEEMYFFTGQAQALYTAVTYGEKAFAVHPHATDDEPAQVYLIFGRESRGLDQDIIDAHLEECVRIPMREGLRSLNLSNAVAIGVYEVVRQWQEIC